MKGYGQYCGLARGLDVVGDRWTLLVVRQLLVGPSRYGELAEGLPGVASNLLAERLRGLVAAGVVERRTDARRNGVVYALTPWGEGLRESVEALIRWSTPLMVDGPGRDSFRPEWLLVALRSFLGARRSTAAVRVGFETADSLVIVERGPAGTTVSFGEPAPPRRPRTVFRAEPGIVLGLASGVLNVDEAVAAGELVGSRRPLERLLRP